MKTYLGFKRVVTDQVTGHQKTETKFVPVDIPGINASDGWKLIGSSDTVEVVPLTSKVQVNGMPITEGEQMVISVMDSAPESKPAKTLPNGSSFESPVAGTAKLVRAGGSVFIAYRRGKKGLNETSPNSVCVSDLVKTQFFLACRQAYGASCENYRFAEGCSEFTHWNKFMDEEYARQLKEVNRKLA